jgi:phosphonate transport system substrate-binding protein
MHLKKYQWAFLLILAGLLPVSDLHAQLVPPEDALVLGIFPRRNATETFKLFGPLTDYLSEKLDRKVVISTQKDMPTFWAALRDGTFDIVHYNQFHYVKSHKEFGYEVILQNEELNEKSLSPVLITRKDSGIKSVKDLSGKTVVFGGGPSAMMSYIGPKYLLRQAGLYTGDYTEMLVKLPPQAVVTAYFAKADAAGSAHPALKIFSNNDRINVDELEILAQGEPLAHLAWAVRGKMEEGLKNRIQSSLLALNQTPDGKQILRAAALTGLNPARDSDYDGCRQLIKEVLNERY